MYCSLYARSRYVTGMLFSYSKRRVVCTGMDLAHRRLTPGFSFLCFWWSMNCVSCDICVYHLGLFVFFPGVFLSSRVTGACPVTTDLIERVNVRTTTTILNEPFFLPNDITAPRLILLREIQILLSQTAVCCLHIKPFLLPNHAPS